MNSEMKATVCLLLLAGSVWAQSERSPAPETPRENLTRPADAQPDLLWQKLHDRVNGITRGLNGVAAVAIVDLGDGRQLLSNADHVAASASTIKLAILAELYRQSQQGGPARLDDAYVVKASDLVPDSYVLGGLTPGVTRLTNRDLATMMIAVSDNSAANILIDRVGMENVNALLRSLGMTHTCLRRKMMDTRAAQEGRENTATARELAQLLESIYSGRLLNAAMTSEFLKVLSTPKDSWIPRMLPDGLKVANKPGSLGGIRNDAGIVFLEGRPFVVCVMTSYLRYGEDGERAISEIARAAFEYFEMSGAASRYGRVMSPLQVH
jgi:beta-lactamase class A